MDIGYIERYQVFETELYSNNLEKYEENRVDYCVEYLGGGGEEDIIADK